MDSDFEDAPLQDGTGKLTIAFTQFFYLVNFETTASASNFKGAVLLCPSVGHTTFLTLATSKVVFKNRVAKQMQIDVFAAPDGGQPTALSLSGLRTQPAGSRNLAPSIELFDRKMPIQQGLVGDRRISSDLNARFVLADGELHEQPPRRPNADVDWYFVRPGHPVKKRKLTDRLDYQLTLRDGQKYWLVISDGRKIQEMHPLQVGTNTLDVFNQDHAEERSFPRGSYILKGFADLHNAVLVLGPSDHGQMRGNIGDEKDGTLVIKGAAEPICGGEQGDPDPPEDPPDPPDPNP